MTRAQTEAKQIVQTLVNAGYLTYFAGGWVRDYLMGHPSDDIDIATEASPDEVQALFPRTLAVGAAFGVILVIQADLTFEVASFRKDGLYVDGRKPTSVDWASAEQDAERRDFTINGMFYDPLKNLVIDYVGGQKDLERGLIRAIGVPHDRIAEDRLRMIRAVRFSARFAFPIEKQTEEAILHFASTLYPAVAVERVWQELQKMARYEGMDHALRMLHRYGLLEIMAPQLSHFSVKDMEDFLLSYHRLPPKLPTILYLLPLFKEKCLKKYLELSEFLRMSREDQTWAKSYFEGEKLLEGELVDDATWARFYANPHSQAVLQVLATLKKEDPEPLLKHHRQRAERLKLHIERIQTKSPLLNGSRLKELGILPGPTMGQLLQEAQKMSVNQDLHSEEDLLVLLRKSPLWNHQQGKSL